MRRKTAKGIFESTYKTYALTGIWGRAIGKVEQGGAWIIWGKEKNGKTTVALMLAEYLSTITDVLYVSGEEGIGYNFMNAMKRAGINEKTRLRFSGYVSLAELEVELEKKRPPKAVMMDNVTIYNDELKYGRLQQLMNKFRSTLFIWIAHEEKGEPYTSGAKLIKRLAKIIIYVEGYTATVGGRTKGGTLIIDEEKAQLYWGQDITDKNTNNEI